MSDILLAPTVSNGPTTKVKDKKTGKVYFKKQILPCGKFKYKDTELDLSDSTLATMAKSFQDRAYDEVTSQFGGTESEHNNDPTRRNGTVVQVEHVPGKGMWGYFDLTDVGQKYVQQFPNVGVSPRIRTGIERADGKKYEAAIEHVVFTNVPRMNGMSPWETVNLSATDDAEEAEVIDLSTEIIEAIRLEIEKTNPVVKKATTESPNTDKKDDNMPQMSEEQINFLNSLMADAKKFEEALSPKEDTPKVEVPVELSNGLTQAQKDAQSALQGVESLRAQALKDSWSAKRRELAGRGVPPAALDLATPIMEAEPAKVFDLSTAEGTVKSDERQQMLSMLELMAGTVDLSEETGHGVGGQTPNEDSVKQEEIDAFLQANGL